MALYFAEDKNNAGGLQKVRLDEETLKDENVQEAIDEKILMSSSEMLGDSKGTIPKETETINEKEVIKTDDGKFSIDIKGALSNVGSSVGAFASEVGSNFAAIAKAVPNKIEEISQDPEKKKNFMRGLEIINASSGIRPIGQAKSPVGSIAEGLLKAEKGFIATDLAKSKIEASKLKSAAAAKSKYMSGKETALSKLYTTYADDFETNRKNYQSVDTRFNEIYKLAKGGKVPPTGILESSFKGLEKVLDEVGLLDEANALIGRNQNTEEFSDKDLIEFKEIFEAATKRQIVGEVKELYPVSNKDIEILLQTVGDISTSPQALRALVAAEKAAKEINESAFGKSYDIAFAGEGNSNFRAESQDAAAKELADKYKDKVDSETLIALYGTDKDNSPFQIVNAYYHQQLEPVYKDQEKKGYFEVFKDKTDIDQADLIQIIKDRQSKKQ